MFCGQPEAMSDEETDDDIDAIRKLPRFRSLACNSCGVPMQVHVLQTYERCRACGTEHKCRSFGGIGTEIQDVIDAALDWAGISPEEIIRRHRKAAAGTAKKSWWKLS